MFGSGGEGGKAGKGRSAKADTGLFGMPAPGAHGGFFTSQPKASGTSSSPQKPVFGTFGGTSSPGESSAGSNPFRSAFSATSSNLFQSASTPSSTVSSLFSAPGKTPPLFHAAKNADVKESSGFFFKEKSRQEGSTANVEKKNVSESSELFKGKPSEGLFGMKSSGSLFGAKSSESGGLFGSKKSDELAEVSLFKSKGEDKRSVSGGLFGAKAAEQSNLFQKPASSSSSTLFGKPQLETGAGGKTQQNVFGKPAGPEQKPFTLYNQQTTFSSSGAAAAAGLFGKPPAKSTDKPATTASGLFEKSSADSGGKKSGDDLLFGKKSTNVFKDADNTTTFGSKPSQVLFGKTDVPQANPFSAPTPGLFSENNQAVASFLSGPSKPLFGGKEETEAKLFVRKTFDPPDITRVKPLSSRLGPVASQQDQESEDAGDNDDNYENEEGDDDDPEAQEEEEEEDEGEQEEGEWNDGEHDYDEPEASVSERVEEKEIVSLPLTEDQPKKKLIRTFSKEELQSITSIICEKVPDILNNKITMEKHFSRFGTVTKVTPNTRTKSTIVHFTDHKSAKQAKDKGKLVHPKCPLIGEIFYSKISPGKGRIRRTTSRSEIGEETEKQTVAPPMPPKKRIFSITKALKPSEPQKSIDLGSSKNSAEMSELLNVMKSQTNNDTDRYAVLEARDKYMRLKYPPSLTRSGAVLEHDKLKGTCPDMCPERERYGRSAKCQLRWFEKEDGILNHFSIIKEHSRSAADQDVPLSHDLRPPSVLSKTLDFLMCNIIDRIDFMGGTMKEWFRYVKRLDAEGLQYTDPMAHFVPVSNEEFHTVADWFEFVWSTTRALRKDITQQNLSDTESVGLVEKCARFHIFCSERLIEEDAHDFDPKLNNENLTKCLQSLKHMYYDLSLEEVSCENEAEFRSYEILLNLNQGDTLREVQSLDPLVRSHPSVNNALSIYFALNSNNYIRFFRLVKKSSYLEMCILKRYFYQVRRKALDIMIRSFLAPKQLLQYPLQKMVDMLAFESGSECCEFLRSHGVESEEESGVIFMEKSAFYYPENQPKVYRSRNLIDSKKTCSFGEIMNGGPLPPNPILAYAPHNSFDANGFLKKESYEAKDQRVEQSPEEIRRLQQMEEKKARLKEAAVRLSELITAEVLNTEVERIAISAVKESRIQSMSMDIYNRIEDEVIVKELSSISSSELRDARNRILRERLEVEKHAEEQEASIRAVVDGFVDEEINSIAEESIKEAISEKKKKEIMIIAQDIQEGIIEEAVKETLGSICEAAMDEFAKERETQILLLGVTFKKKLLSRCFRAWRTSAMKTRKKREAISDFPATPSHLALDDQRKMLNGSTKSRISLSKLQRERGELDSMMKILDTQESLLHSAILLPFDILQMLEDSMKGVHQGSVINIKLLLSTENLGSDSPYYPVQQMVKRKFQKIFPQDPPADADLLVLRTVPFNRSVLSFCVRNLTEASIEAATFSERERRWIFCGTSGVLFIHLEPTEDPTQRLRSTLVNLPKVPGVPLQVITCWNVEEFIQKTGLNSFKEDGTVLEYDIHQISANLYNMQDIVTITDAVRKLIEHTPADPTKGLSKKTLLEFVEGFLANHIFGEMTRNLRDRHAKGLTDRPFTDLVNLYNKGLDHLQEVLMDPALMEVSWPVPEFGLNHTDRGAGFELPVDWNDSLRIDEVAKVIDELKLEDHQVYECDTWKDLVEQIWVYVDNICCDNFDTSVLVSELRRSLMRTYRKFAAQCCSMGGKEKTTPPPELLPWTDILISCAQYRFSCLCEPDLIVGYYENRLLHFILPEDWTSGLSWKTEHEETSVKGHAEISVIADRNSMEQEQTLLNPNLRDLLRTEQKLSMKLESRLEDALSEDYVPDPSKSLSFYSANQISPGWKDDLTSPDLSMYESFVLDESLVEAGVESVPVISYVSPSLGCMIPALTGERRKERVDTGMSPRLQRRSGEVGRRSMEGKETSRSAGKKRKADQFSTKEKRRCKLNLSPDLELNGRLDVLKHTISSEITESQRLENLLKAALNNG